MTRNRCAKTGHVVEGLPISACFGVSRPCEDNNRTAWRRKALHRCEYAGGYGAVALVVCLVLLLCAMPVNVAFADESRNTPGQMTVTDNITDTQNLLGDNVGAVTDAIKKTKKESGVDVRLLYVDTFGDVSNPERWASDVLESTKPAPNTVMLAIASGDGNLVVVVSPKSDEWLSSKKTADELSKAALDPLTSKDTPDWSGSAIAMMNRLDTLSQTSTSSKTSRIGVGLMIAIPVALLAAVAIVMLLRRRRAAGAIADDAAAAGSMRTDGTEAADEAAEDSAAPAPTRGRRSGRHRR